MAKQKDITSEFGPVYKQFKKKPQEAIRHLINMRDGECIDALYREDIGYIDIVWGKVTDPVKHTGYGLAHIIDKHGADIEALGFSIEAFIPIIVQYGNFNTKKSDSNKKVYESNNFRFVIAIQSNNGSIKKWLLTAFDIVKKPK